MFNSSTSFLLISINERYRETVFLALVIKRRHHQSNHAARIENRLRYRKVRSRAHTHLSRNFVIWNLHLITIIHLEPFINGVRLIRKVQRHLTENIFVCLLRKVMLRAFYCIAPNTGSNRLSFASYVLVRLQILYCARFLFSLTVFARARGVHERERKSRWKRNREGKLVLWISHK